MTRETLLAILLALAAAGAQAQAHRETTLLTREQERKIRIETARLVDHTRVRVAVCNTGGVDYVIGLSVAARAYVLTDNLREMSNISDALQRSVDRHLADAGCRVVGAGGAQ